MGGGPWDGAGAGGVYIKVSLLGLSSELPCFLPLLFFDAFFIEFEYALAGQWPAGGPGMPGQPDSESD